MKIVYAVNWIEVEFGQRNEGYHLYLDKADCIKSTKEASARGCYEGGYYGPERPLIYVEVPWACLDAKHKKALKTKGSTTTANNWKPQFKGKRLEII